MSDVIRRTVVVVSATVLYYGLLYYVVGYSFTAVPGPRILEPLLGSYRSAALTWVQLVHTLAVLVAAIPVALLLRLVLGHVLWLSFVPGLLCAAFDRLYSILYASAQVHLSTTAIAFLIVDVLKIVLAVPLILWLLNMLPSNNRLQRSGEG